MLQHDVLASILNNSGNIVSVPLGNSQARKEAPFLSAHRLLWTDETIYTSSDI